MSEGRPGIRRVRRLGRIARRITALAVLITLVAWGVFATTTIVPNQNDQTSVYGAFQSTSPFQWLPSGSPDHHNIPPGSTIDYVFEIAYSLNGGGGCNGGGSTSAPSGTIVAYCNLPTPNSTLTSRIGDYLAFSIQNDRGCCQQNYLSWLSGPSGNLTGYASKGFFEVDQAGNYSVHISNTVPVIQGANPLGYVNGTLNHSDGFIFFTRPYFFAGVATLVVAIVAVSLTTASLIAVWKHPQ